MTMSGAAAPSDLLGEYLRVRATTEQLASVLSAEDQTVQTMPDVSPTKWHRAHVTWFFETFVLGEYATGYHAFVDGQMDALLRDPDQPGLMDLITLGLHHEQQHQELLLMDIKHVLSRNPLHPVYLPTTLTRAESHPPKAGWLEHGG